MLEPLRLQALALLRDGRFAEAERLCVGVLRQQPADFDAHLTLGDALMALSRHGEALASYDAALALRPQHVIALTSSAAALRALGRPEEALSRASVAVALQPNGPAFFQLGAALRHLGRYDEAVATFDLAIAHEPDLVEAHTSRGIALRQLERNVESLASFDRALQLRPSAAELHNNRGNVLRRLQRLPEALASFDRAIALQPRFAIAYNNRGLVLQMLRQFEAATASYERALALQPNYADAHSNLGMVQYELGQSAKAFTSWKRAQSLQPNMHGLHSNLSSALRDLGRPLEALAESQAAISEEPTSAVAHCNRANALFDLGRFAEALDSYDRAVELDPRYPLAHFNKGLCLLLSGDFGRGLLLYEWRKQLSSYARVPGPGRYWLGEEEIAGKTLLVQVDQALGDTIQFCRYAKLAAKRGAQVVLAVQPQLRELLSDLDSRIRIVCSGKQPETFDFHCDLMSLPLAFKTTLANIPADTPYLFAEPLRALRWRRQLGEAGFKVGIVWQGSRNRIDVGRSVPLEFFGRLAKIPGVRLISLQKNVERDQLRAASDGLGIEVLEEFDEGPQAFLDSAAVIAHLDLIITSDTAMAHLSGALGRPTWVAIKHVPDWRWLLDRTDCPWYPSMRLFRQSSRGDWDVVFDTMRVELAALAKQHNGLHSDCSLQ